MQSHFSGREYSGIWQLLWGFIQCRWRWCIPYVASTRCVLVGVYNSLLTSVSAVTSLVGLRLLEVFGKLCNAGVGAGGVPGDASVDDRVSSAGVKSAENY